MPSRVSGEARRVTLLDVAAEAGVSRATASLVLRDSPLVAEPTRAHVRAAMAKLGYVYHRAAANMRMQGTKVVGLLIPEIQNLFFAELVVGLDEVLDKAGYVA